MSTEGWRFDDQKVPVKERWSYKRFKGQDWQNGRVHGVVLRKCGEKWLVQWEDGAVIPFETSYLSLENNIKIVNVLHSDETAASNGQQFTINVESQNHMQGDDSGDAPFAPDSQAAQEVEKAASSDTPSTSTLKKSKQCVQFKKIQPGKS